MERRALNLHVQQVSTPYPEGEFPGETVLRVKAGYLIVQGIGLVLYNVHDYLLFNIFKLGRKVSKKAPNKQPLRAFALGIRHPAVIKLLQILLEHGLHHVHFPDGNIGLFQLAGLFLSSHHVLHKLVVGFRGEFLEGAGGLCKCSKFR